MAQRPAVYQMGCDNAMAALGWLWLALTATGARDALLAPAPLTGTTAPRPDPVRALALVELWADLVFRCVPRTVCTRDGGQSG